MTAADSVKSRPHYSRGMGYQYAAFQKSSGGTASLTTGLLGFVFYLHKSFSVGQLQV